MSCDILPLKMGSSPRVWGQDDCFTIMPTPEGIIPTRVGTRVNTDFPALWQRDHPHACGDKSWYVHIAKAVTGSSPRVWGQDALKHSSFVLYGIIPTRVGTRLKKSRKIAVLQNQPLRFPLTFHRSFV